MFASSGVEFNFNISNKNRFTQWFHDGTKKSETIHLETGSGHEFRKFNLSALAGIGMDIQVHSKIALFFQPIYRQQLFSYIAHQPIKRRLNSAGLVTGIEFRM